MFYKEDVMYVITKQLGAVASVKMMNTWKNLFLYVTQNQR